MEFRERCHVATAVILPPRFKDIPLPLSCLPALLPARLNSTLKLIRHFSRAIKFETSMRD